MPHNTRYFKIFLSNKPETSGKSGILTTLGIPGTLRKLNTPNYFEYLAILRKFEIFAVIDRPGYHYI